MILFFMNFSLISTAHAAPLSDSFFNKIRSVGEKTFDSSQGIPLAPEIVVGQVLSYIFGFLGIIFLILAVYGGWQWMTAQGNEEQVTKARKVVMDGIVGLLVIVLAYTLTNVIIDAIITKTGTGTFLQ